MFAEAGVPSDDDTLYGESNVPKPTKSRRFEDCDFLEDYDDESTESAGQVNDEQQCVCRKQSPQHS